MPQLRQSRRPTLRLFPRAAIGIAKPVGNQRKFVMIHDHIGSLLRDDKFKHSAGTSRPTISLNVTFRVTAAESGIYSSLKSRRLIVSAYIFSTSQDRLLKH